MAVKFLDYTGLGYLWSKIKAWCNATFAAITHNHASNAVNAMTGYSKPNSGSAIAASDSLNSAIGKLEAKVDAVDQSNVVHITGTETITGQKFLINRNLKIKSTSINIGAGYNDDDISVSEKFGTLSFHDANNKWAGAIETAYRSDGTHDFKIYCTDWANPGDTSDFAAIYIGYDSNGIKYANAPSTSTSRNNAGDILTRDWIPNDTRIVHTTGNETVNGLKTFTSNIDIVRATPKMHFYNTGMVKGTNPSSTQWNELLFCDETGDATSAHRFGQIAAFVDADGKSVVSLYAYNWASGSTASSNLGIAYPKDGTPYTWAPTPAASDSSSKIATTSWVSSADCVVHTTGNETISGIKTHNNSISLLNDSFIQEKVTIKRNTTPSSNTYWWPLKVLDGNGNNLCGLYFEYTTGKQTGLHLLCYKGTSTDNTWASLKIGYDSSGNVYTAAPTPATADNSTKIATTAFVKAQGYLTSQTQLSLTNSGSGNAVTSISVSNHAITVTKGSTFLTSHQSLSNYVTLNTEQTISRGKHFWYWSSFKDQTYTYKQQVYCIIQFRDKNDNIYGSNKVFGSSDGKSAYYQWILNDPTKAIGNDVTIELTVSNSTWSFCPVGDNDNAVTLGSGGRRWKQLYAGTTTIETSDKRLKNSISDIPNKVLDAWDKINWVQFKFNDAINEKPVDQVRLHTGLIAQDIQQVMLNDDIDISKYGLFCYDTWEHKDPIYDREGNIIHKEEQAGDRYSLRYEEALCMEAAYQRRKNKILENRISELEKQVSDMLILLQNLTNGNG